MIISISATIIGFSLLLYAYFKWSNDLRDICNSADTDEKKQYLLERYWFLR